MKNMDQKPKSRNRPEPHVLFGIETSFAADFLDTLAATGNPHRRGYTAEPASVVPAWHPHCPASGEISPLLLELPVILCPVTPNRREEAHLHAMSLGFNRFISVVDPTATLPGGLYRGRGLFINAHATLGAEVELDDFVTVNRAASVGHHTVLEAFSTVGPGATLASQCRIGRSVMIGTGAVVAPSVSWGRRYSCRRRGSIPRCRGKNHCDWESSACGKDRRPLKGVET